MGNLSEEQDMEITVQRGTVFQHIDWQHRQNLIVPIDSVIPVAASSTVSKELLAFCMNVTCACSSGNPLSLTEFFIDNTSVLESQGAVWDHFEGCFASND